MLHSLPPQPPPFPQPPPLQSPPAPSPGGTHTNTQSHQQPQHHRSLSAAAWLYRLYPCTISAGSQATHTPTHTCPHITIIMQHHTSPSSRWPAGPQPGGLTCEKMLLKKPRSMLLWFIIKESSWLQPTVAGDGNDGIDAWQAAAAAAAAAAAQVTTCHARRCTASSCHWQFNTGLPSCTLRLSVEVHVITWQVIVDIRACQDTHHGMVLPLGTAACNPKGPQQQTVRLHNSNRPSKLHSWTTNQIKQGALLIDDHNGHHPLHEPCRMPPALLPS